MVIWASVVVMLRSWYFMPIVESYVEIVLSFSLTSLYYFEAVFDYYPILLTRLSWSISIYFWTLSSFFVIFFFISFISICCFSSRTILGFWAAAVASAAYLLTIRICSWSECWLSLIYELKDVFTSVIYSLIELYIYWISFEDFSWRAVSFS